MKRLIHYTLGITMVGIGINMLIHSDKGLDPWGVFNVAVAGSLNVSLGTFYIYSGVFFVVINAIAQKKSPNAWGMATAFFMGLSIDLLKPFAISIVAYSPWLEFILGLTLFCLGLALYLSTRLPQSPVDDLILSLQKITKKSFKTSKITLDLVVFMIGLFLGGTIGLGTILMVVFVGPLITIFMELLEGRNGKNNLFRFRRYTYSNTRKL